MGAVTGVWHVGITVKDMEKSLEFYRDLLGFELESQTEIGDFVLDIVDVPGTKTIKFSFLKIPGSDISIELLEYQDVETHSASSRPCDYGAGHLCVFVSDLTGMHQRLLEKGVKFRSAKPVPATDGLAKGGQIIYMRDPDDFLIELVELPKDNI